MTTAMAAGRRHTPGPVWRGRVALCAIVLAGSAVPGGAAEQVYRWVDEAGVVHLGDQAPPPGARPEVLAVPDYAEPGQAPVDDPYSIANQLERLQARRAAAARERRDRELADREYRLRLRELEARQEAAEAPGPPVYFGPPARPVIAPYPPRPHHPYPAHRPGPGIGDDHPAYRPPGHYPPRPRPRGRIELDR